MIRLSTGLEEDEDESESEDLAGLVGSGEVTSWGGGLVVERWRLEGR